MSGKKSQRKGKTGEYELAELLTQITGREIERAANHDITGFDFLHCECKRNEQFRINEWLHQAKEDAGDKVPFVCFRRNRDKWKVVIEMEDLRQFVVRMYLNFCSESEGDNANQNDQGQTKEAW